MRIAVAAARFNNHVVERLVSGALDALEATGMPRQDVTIVWVPGSFELPLAVRRLAKSARYDAIVALGCVVRGETSHNEHVGRAATDGLLRVMLDTGLPVGFGVLTTETVEQAMARSGGAAGNRGFDAAVAAIEMVGRLKDL
jgi:6,7-dimethyl-8-ribityllumazine synthase